MKKRIIVFALILLVFISLSVMDTYGLFETNGNSSNTFEIGKWQIYINDQDVTLDRDVTLDDFIYESDVHTEEGYLAPGGSATLDLVIDYQNVDTMMEYSIDLDKSDLDEFPNLDLKIIDLSTNEEVSLENSTGIVFLDEVNRVQTYRLLLTWENDEEYDLNDINVIEKDISFKLNVHFSQVKEE